MRKLLLAALAASALVPSGVSAQSAREVRHDQREINMDIARGHYKEAREDQNELNQDWRAYRRTHPAVFDRPTYVAPRGFRYSRMETGGTLNDAFFTRHYRIDNYTTYRLGYPGRNRAWVRYGNDVLLVNLRNGHIIQAYYDFFV